jgi:hypothetical protein
MPYSVKRSVVTNIGRRALQEINVSLRSACAILGLSVGDNYAPSNSRAEAENSDGDARIQNRRLEDGPKRKEGSQPRSSGGDRHERGRRIRETAESFPASDAPSYNRGVEAFVRRPQGFARPDELKWTTMGGDKPMSKEEKSSSSIGYLIGGVVLGAVCGLLFAPKKGSELREDISDWGRDKKARGRELFSRAKEYIPHRDKQAVES